MYHVSCVWFSRGHGIIELYKRNFCRSIQRTMYGTQGTLNTRILNYWTELPFKFKNISFAKRVYGRTYHLTNLA